MFLHDFLSAAVGRSVGRSASHTNLFIPVSSPSLCFKRSSRRRGRVRRSIRCEFWNNARTTVTVHHVAVFKAPTQRVGSVVQRWPGKWPGEMKANPMRRSITPQQREDRQTQPYRQSWQELNGTITDNCCPLVNVLLIAAWPRPALTTRFFFWWLFIIRWSMWI